VHQIDEFNIKKHNIFLRGSMPPNPPRGTGVHSPQISQNLWGKIGIAIPMQLLACFMMTVPIVQLSSYFIC